MTPRDYKKEYGTYQGTTKQKKNRAKRNNARRRLLREGRVHKGDNKDVHHIRPLKKGGSNSNKNLRVISRKANRSKK